MMFNIFFVFISYLVLLLGTRELEGNSPIGADVPEFSGPLHSRAEMGSDCLFESPGNSAFVFDYGKLETPMQISSPVRSCSLSLTDWLPGDRIGVSVDHFVYSSIDSNEIQNQISNCSTMFNFSEGDGNNISDCMDHVNLAQMKTEFENEFGHVEGDLHSNCTSSYLLETLILLQYPIFIFVFLISIPSFMLNRK